MTTYPLRRTMQASWAHLGAMHHLLDPRDFRVVGEYLSIGDLAPTHGRPVVCCINGDYISRADWWQPVRAGDVIVFAEPAASGDTGRLLATLVIAVASAYTGGAVGAAYGAGWGAAASAGVTIVGGLLVNKMFPVEAMTGPSGADSPTYSTQLEGNRPRQGQAVPVRYGQEEFFPDLACPPYSEFGEGSNQYYCTGLAVGLGEYNILGIYVGDTPIQNFQDVEVVIVGPGQSTRTQKTGYEGVELWAHPGFVGPSEPFQEIIEVGMITADEVAGQEILDDIWIGPFTVTPSGWATDKLFFDFFFPRGVGNVGSTGGISAITIGWQVAWQPIDDSGLPLGGWTQESGSYTGNQSSPVRISTAYDVPPARYRARMRRATPRSDNERRLNDMQWAQMRGRLSVPGITRDDLTGVVIRVRATQQMSALTQRRIKVLAQRLIPVWNGTTWSDPEFSRNPAWALADVWRQPVYGRGLPDSRIDLASLLEYSQVWAARQDRFDFSFDSQMTTDDAAQLVASAGRARTMLRRAAVYSLVRDELQTDAAAVYMPRNIDRDSFSQRWALPTSETPDAVAATYRSGRYWAPRTVYAQIYDGVIHGYVASAAGLPLRPAGVPAPALIEGVDLQGVIGEHQALRQAVYLLARMMYRRVEGEFSADMDGLLMSMGSMIGMAHDTAGWGQSGDVVLWDEDTLTMTLTEPPQWTPGQTHYIRLQSNTGAPGGAIEVTPGDTDFKVVLAESPSFTPVTNSPDRERTRYLFGALADVQRQVIAAGLRPTSVDTVQVAYYVEDARVHSADDPWLPVGDEEQDPLADGTVSNGNPGGGGDPGDPGGGDPEWLPIVKLTSALYEYTSVAGIEYPRIVLELGNDGRLRIDRFTGVNESISEQWLVFAPYAPSVAALMEVYVTFNGVVDMDSVPKVIEPNFGDPLGVWLNLGETRRWGLDISEEPLRGAGFVSPLQLVIRDVATETYQASADITISVTEVSIG